MKVRISEIKIICQAKSGAVTAFLTLILLLTDILIISCTKSDSFSTGKDFVEPITKLSIVDTFRVDLSTVLLDSIPSSGTSIALVGQYFDNDFGALSSIGYFEPGFNTLNIEENAIFDSAAVSLVFSGYSFGDTTSLMSISIHQLNERIDLRDNNYLYNRSSFSYSDKPLGTIVFYPEPHSTDTLLNIQVNEFGEKLFGMFLNKDNNVSSNDLLIKYLNGFVIKSDFGNSIIGFKIDDTRTFLRFYYHLDDLFNTKSELKLPYGSTTSKQFNSVKNDFTGTYLEKLKFNNTETPSEETGNIAYFQAMVGLLPKIQFPTLQDITLENNWKILKAELVFEPVKTSYDLFELPALFCLYRTDKYNKVGNVLKNYSDEVVYSSLKVDELYNENTSYVFDITSFIINELNDLYFDSEQSLYIGLKEGDLNKSFERLMIECKNPAVKLRIYYLTY